MQSLDLKIDRIIAASTGRQGVHPRIEHRFNSMKTRSWLLALVAAISGLAMLVTPAQAGGKKKHHHRDWNDAGYTYYRRGWDNRGYWDDGGYRYYQPYYRRAYYPEPYYGPVYQPGPVIEFRFQSE